MLDPELLERITARRTELDELEEQLAKQLTEIRAERDELAAARPGRSGCARAGSGGRAPTDHGWPS